MASVDALYDEVGKIVADLETEILVDMARRIKRMGKVSEATQWQLEKLEELGAQHTFVRSKLAELMDKTEYEIVRLFDRAAADTLKTADKAYKVRGYEPIPLSQNEALQDVIKSALRRTRGELINLTQTTAGAANRQFIRVADAAHRKIVSGAFDYQTAIKQAIQELSKNGVLTMEYPSGHKDYLDVAMRRAVLTGVNQTVGDIQTERMREMGCNLCEVSAHSGAREEHAVWQGKIFWMFHPEPGYESFEEATDYGSVTGIYGANCRHIHFPFFKDSKRAWSDKKLKELTEETVTFEGEEIPLHKAKGQQRYIERQIRRWKREASAMDAAELNPNFAKNKVREWQARQRDFLSQTGLRRDYFRERAGKQNWEVPRGVN